MPQLTIFTIGHSNHAPDAFVALLRRHGITAVADVRSSPCSRHVPQFNKRDLEALLGGCGIAYVHLGDLLGARRADPSCCRDGRVSFELLSATAAFREGLRRVREGAARFRLALLCAEKDPITCHRMILVCRRLKAPDVSIRHVREDGRLESNDEAESRLLEALGLSAADLFASREQLLEEAYDRQGAGLTSRRDPQ